MIREGPEDFHRGFVFAALDQTARELIAEPRRLSLGGDRFPARGYSGSGIKIAPQNAGGGLFLVIGMSREPIAFVNDGLRDNGRR